MAGGIGSRFWPKSQIKRPKQFLDILGVGRTLLQQTFDRFRRICKTENILVVTGEDYAEMVAEQLPELNRENILSEPYRRNTAPCIAYASYKIFAENTEANIVVSPADHFIGDERGFEETIIRGLQFAKFNPDTLLTVGIIPTRPETGYGYIQIDSQTGEDPLAVNEVTKVKLFTEKPNLEMAKIFVESKEFFWNAGIFVWNVKSIINAFEAYQSDMADLFNSGNEFYNTPAEKEYIEKIYSECSNVSIDYGIMEHHSNIYVIPALFPWSDLGTWGSLYENLSKDENGNVVTGTKVLANNTEGCIISSDTKLIVVDGLKDYVIAQSDGMLLIAPKSNEANIRNLVNAAKLKFGDDFA
jgi:mannose-1-phosphate guanylyltransferase